MRWIVVGAVLGVAALAGPANAAVPRSFAGIYDEDAANLPAEASAGVGIVRRPFDWSQVERSRGRYDFSPYDGFMAAAARAGVAVLPIVTGPTPAFWSSKPRNSRSKAVYPPKSFAAYAAFARAAVRRYGPQGSFWRAHPELTPLPIHSWQIWNEPNIPNWWRSGPSPRGYTRMLRVAYRAIKRVDRRAEVVAAGLPNSKLGVPFLRFLSGMYRAGAKRWFDTLAIHPYARRIRGLLRLAQLARQRMNRHGDRARLWVTELGWSTGGDASVFRVSEQGQAARISAALRGLIARRRSLRLRGFVVFRWKDAVAPPGLGKGDPWPLHAGLLRVDGSPKPSYDAFARIVRALGTTR
jgi:hypothetical protein